MGFLAYLKKKLWTEHWNIAVAPLGVDDLLEGDLESKREVFSWPLKERRGGFWADPFLFEKDGGLFVFFEELDEKEKGRIMFSCLRRIGDIFEASIPQLALEKTYHLSYPFVFEKEGSVYLLPESADSGRLTLYKASDFPVRWMKVKTLIPNFPAIDATLFEYEKKFWIFCGKRGSENNELYAFWSDSLLGTWTAHQKNPIKKGFAVSRPAGPIFEKDGKLFRPAQDCSQTYGGAMRIFEIKKLSSAEFEEEEFRKIEPFDKKYSAGVHQVSFSKNAMTLDSKRFGFLKKMFFPFVKYLKK